jgi:WhiB family transcriptional regulator, redox-sensing transcriptional regulator
MWDQAACREMDTRRFFAEPGERHATAQAKLICGGCPVRARCLEYAIGEGITAGVWGGLDARERLLLRNRRANHLAGQRQALRA